MVPLKANILVILGLVSIVYGATTVDECKKAEYEKGPECCVDVDGKADKQMEQKFEKMVEDCMKEFYQKQKPELLSYKKNLETKECVYECVFNLSNVLVSDTNILTPDMKLNKEEIVKWYEDDPDPRWETVDEAVIDDCIKKSEAEVETSAQCKSGSFQFLTCTFRERFFRCPKKYWKDTEECTKYKAVVEKCPYVIPEFQ